MGPGKDTHSTLVACIAGRLCLARFDQTADTRQTWLRSRLLRTCIQRDGTLGCRSGARYHRRRTTLSRAEWLGSTCSRHDEETDDGCVRGNLKQGVFPKRDHHQQLV